MVGIAALSLTLSLSTKADFLFKNSSTDQGDRFDPGTSEVGNQIFLTQGGYITNFSFEYGAFGGGPRGDFSGTFVQARVFWYLNDGPTITQGALTAQAPGTILKDSGWIDLLPTGASAAVLDFSTATGDLPIAPPGGTDGLFIPGRELTWTVQFRGMGLGDRAGLELFGPRTVGEMYTDYWMKNGSTWQLMVNTNGFPITFGQEWMGTPVPEPSVLALSLVGGMGLFLAVRRLRD